MRETSYSRSIRRRKRNDSVSIRSNCNLEEVIKANHNHIQKLFHFRSTITLEIKMLAFLVKDVMNCLTKTNCEASCDNIS